MNPIISTSNLTKKYQFVDSSNKTKYLLFKKNEKKEVIALNKVNLKIYKGDRIGIIGPNGSGKSTLLKILAGVTKPTNGEVFVDGKVVLLMDLETGFHPDLTGAENLYVNGMLIGMSKTEIKEKWEQILSFADIGDFINAPFFTYSDGMKFRLAFAITMASECDILIMDEVFMAGDLEFQTKSMQLLRKLQNKKNLTTIICSHVAGLIFNFANTFFQLKNGELSNLSKDDTIKLMSNTSKSWKKTFHY